MPERNRLGNAFIVFSLHLYSDSGQDVGAEIFGFLLMFLSVIEKRKRELIHLHARKYTHVVKDTAKSFMAIGRAKTFVKTSAIGHGKHVSQRLFQALSYGILSSA